MKNKLKITGLVLFMLIVLILSGYFLLSSYYSKVFGLNTWINGVYCTGKTVDEVNTELLSQMEAPVHIITDIDGNKYKLNMADMNYRIDYLSELKGFKAEQEAFSWIDNVSIPRNYEITSEPTYDKELLKQAFFSLEPIKNEQQRDEMAYLMLTKEEGYVIYNGFSQRLDAEKLFTAFLESVERGETDFNINDADCFYDLPLNEEQKELKELGDKLEAYFQCDIVYDMGTEQIAFDKRMLSEFLCTDENDKVTPVLDENGNLVLNREAVATFVSDLAMKYDTYQKEREFLSTRGDIVKIQGGTYGTQLNQEAEIEFLMNNLLAEDMHTGTEQLHIPVYKREGNVRGNDDIGTTYVEVDMTEQKLYYYEEGKLVIETDIVTGNMRRGMDTPEGVNYVYAKQKDRILRGPGYATPVDYWMPVNGGIGIHDANWRDEFGGEIYKTDGSHGCINIPPKIMPKIYEQVEIGTPVVMFY